MERDHSEDLGVDGSMESEWVLGRRICSDSGGSG
jgi:hypothetical protein